MAELRTLVEKIRSKNAGPFWLTIDIFCGNEETFRTVVNSLATDKIADLLNADPEGVKRFEIPSLNVIKFSLPRQQVQGSIHDRDMHGASWAALISEIEI